MLFTLFTLGCKVNTYESDAIRELFFAEGWVESKAGEIPDLVVINTCTVTSTAAKKSRQHIRKFRHAYPQALLAVMGCYSQEEGENVIADCGADLIIGTTHRKDIIQYIKTGLQNSKRQVILDNNPREFDYEEIATLFQPLNSRAFVKIQDGCDNFCSYCIIPYVRGKSRSRDPQAVINEIKTLVKNGYQEIVITGIHTGGYGKDLPNYSFSKLIADILKNVPELLSLRISSIEATEIDDDFLALLASYKNIANHLHIPLQSGSETVLRRMNRRYRVADFLLTLQKIRHVRPTIAITSDVIVGFPGESDAEFISTKQFIEKAAFSELHVFPFSKRENTAAASMPDQVDSAIKKKRVTELLNLSNQLQEKYANNFIGETMDILFEDYDSKTQTYRGHASNYLQVHIKSPNDIRGQLKKIIYRGPFNSILKDDVF